MATIHLECTKEDVAEKVIFVGDPKRAKYIADNYLKDTKCINEVRGMLAFTGTYNGKKISVFSHGMGIPSIGIYSYELFNYYDVQSIIRVGTSGGLSPNINIGDIVIADSATTDSAFGTIIYKKETKIFEADSELVDKMTEICKKINVKYHRGKIYTSDIFDLYYDISYLTDNKNYLACEMEAFGLFLNAHRFNRKAACIVTVTDSRYKKDMLTSEERQKNLDHSITIALEAI